MRAINLAVGSPQVGKGFGDVQLNRALVDVHARGDFPVGQVLGDAQTDGLAATVGQVVYVLQE